MKRRTLFVMMAIMLLMLPAQGYAKGLYVRDWITISVRSDARDAARVIGMANSNDYLEILQQNEKWAKVRTPDGKVGWVLNRYLTDKTPKALIVDQLSEKVQIQEEKIRSLRDENKQFQKENREQKYKISSLSKDVSKVQGQYDNLKQDSSAYLELKAKHDKLLEQDKSRGAQMEALAAENRSLKNSERLMFILLGGGFVIFGMIIGALFQALRLRPKRAGYKL